MSPLRTAAATALLLASSGCAVISPPDALHPDEPGISSRAAPEGQLLAGAAAVDVTPEGTVFMGGFGILRRSAGVHDPIMARAVAVRRGELTCVLVGVDVVGLHNHHVQQVRARLAGRVPPEGLLVAATHNHDGPDTMGFWGLPPLVSGLSYGYQERLLDGIAAACAQAIDRLEPVRVRWGSVRAPEVWVSRNRRERDLIDRTVTAVAFDRPDGTPVATLVHFACHPETLGSSNRLLSADFPAALCATVEAGRPGGVAVFLNGPLGGMVTTHERADTFAEAERIGTQLGRLALGALRAGAPLSRRADGALDLACARAEVQVPIQNRSYHLGDLFGLFGGRPFAGGYTPSEVMAVRLGRLVLLTVPGEALPRVGFELEGLVGREPTLVVGLGGDELGYLIHEDDFERELYDYERTVSPGPLATTLLRTTAARLVEAVGAGAPAGRARAGASGREQEEQRPRDRERERLERDADAEEVAEAVPPGREHERVHGR